MVFTAVARATPWSWNDSRKRTSPACRWRIRYTTASAAVGSSEGARNWWLRAETSTEMESMPGVSISVVPRKLCEGQSTVSRSILSGAVPPRSNVSAPSLRWMDSWRGLPGGEPGPPRGCSVTRGVGPSWYQVTTRVHSPASVGAISSPTRALSSVDLPALTLPAMATRSGSSKRARCVRSQWLACGESE